MKRYYRFGSQVALWGALLLAHPWSVVRAQSGPEPVFAAVEGERLVEVYDENANGVADTKGDTWLFLEPASRTVQLAIRYRIEDEFAVAYLYDDTGEDGRVDVARRSGRLEIGERQWRVRVAARDPGTGWRLTDGRPNWNLDLGAASAYQMSGTDADIALLDSVPARQASGGQLDGQVWVTVQIWDLDRDGVPDLELDNVSLQGYGMDAIIANRNPRLNLTPDEQFPLLGTLIQLYSTIPRIRLLSHAQFIPTRTNEEGYFVYFNQYSGESFGPDGHRFGWESPFAYYDLAGDQDGKAELAIRMVNDFAMERFGYYDEAHYTWTDRSDGADYSLALFGLHGFEHIVQYPFFPVMHHPWEGLPWWIFGRRWLAASFKEDEGGRYARQIGEDIYGNGEWEAQVRGRLIYREFARGIAPYLPQNLGIREEIALRFNDTPRLYVSGIDRRLHMVGAESGIVVLSAPPNPEGGVLDFTIRELTTGTADTFSKVEYGDTDRDGYVDRWTWLVDDQPAARLQVKGSVIVYHETGSAPMLKRLPADFKSIAAELGPPRDTAEWAHFHETMAPFYQDRPALSELRLLFVSLPGDVQEVSGLAALDIYNRPHGLELLAEIADPIDLPPWFTGERSELSAGERVLLRIDETLVLRRIEPSHLSILTESLSGLEGPLEQHLRTEIRLTVQNQGGETLENQSLLLVASQDGIQREIGSLGLFLAPFEQRSVVFGWVPEAAGRWQLSFYQLSGAEALGRTRTLREPLFSRELAVAPRSLDQVSLTLPENGSAAWPILLGLAAIGATLSALLFLRSTAPGTEDA